MSRPLLTTAERFRRARRDWEEYQRRSLYRRSHPRFERDLRIAPHRFLDASAIRVARLRASADEIRGALRGVATWTLDTALLAIKGLRLFKAGDLTGYLPETALAPLASAGLIEAPESLPVSLDPVIRREPLLVAHLTLAPPPSWVTEAGERVVTLEALKSDLLGTLGWRPDLLTRLEALYPTIAHDREEGAEKLPSGVQSTPS